MQKSLPNIFKWKGFNNLLNKPTARESCFPSSGGDTKMPNSSNLLSMSDWGFWASLSFFSFFPLHIAAVICSLVTRRVHGLPLADSGSSTVVRTPMCTQALTWAHWKGEGRWLKQPDLPGNSHTTVCFSASSAWEESTPPSPWLGTSLFNLSNRSKDLFLPLARLLLTVWNRKDCLLLPFATQVIEIFISPGRTAGCYFCFIQFVSSVDNRGPWRGAEDLQLHLSHRLASATLLGTNGKFCTHAVCVLPYSQQNQTVIEIPTRVLPLQERLETGSEQMLGAAFKFCSLLLP